MTYVDSRIGGLEMGDFAQRTCDSRPPVFKLTTLNPRTRMSLGLQELQHYWQAPGEATCDLCSSTLDIRLVIMVTVPTETQNERVSGPKMDPSVDL